MMDRRMMIEDELAVLMNNIVAVKALPVTGQTEELLGVLEQLASRFTTAACDLQDALIQKLPILYVQINRLQKGETNPAAA